MPEHECETCGTRFTSAAAVAYCCTDTDKYGRAYEVEGGDWLP